MAEATYSWGQLADWYKQHGGAERGRQPAQVDVPNPQYGQMMVDGSNDTRPTIKVPAVEITATDGSTIVVQENPAADGGQPSYTVHQHLDAPPKPPTAASAQPNQVANAEARAAQDTAERQANQAKGLGFNSDAEVQAAKDKAAAAAKAAQGGGTLVDQGTAGVFIVKPDGSSVKTDLPAKPQPNSTSQAKGDDGTVYVISVDPAGNVTTKVAIPPTPAGPPVPASATGWTPDFSKPDLGVFARRTAVQGQLEGGVFGDPASAGAQAKANQLLAQDLEFAKVAAANVSGIQAGEKDVYGGAIQQRGQDVTTTNARTAAAQGIFNQALSTMASLLPAMKQNSKTAGPMFEALLQKGYEFQQQMGGQVNAPTIEMGPYSSRTAPIFQPGYVDPMAAAAAPAPPPAPPVIPTAAAAPLAPPPSIDPGPYVPPPTGAPRTVPPAPLAPVPPLSDQARDTTGSGYPGMVMPTSEQPRDTTGPGYPGQSPSPDLAPPADPSLTPDQQTMVQGQAPQMDPVTLAAYAQSPFVQAMLAQRQQSPLVNNVAAIAPSLGFSPEVIAAAFPPQRAA